MLDDAIALAPTLTLALFASTLPAGAQEKERVVLDLQRFLEMYEKNKAEKPEEPARDHAISSGRYRGEVLFEDGKPYAARFSATLHVRPLRPKGFCRIPLLPATVALESATIEGKEAPVYVEGGFYFLLTDRRTEFDLALSFGAAVTSAEGSTGISFQLVPSGATSLSLSVPSNEDLDFTVTNAKLQSDKVVGDARVVEATIPATGALAIQWQRKVDDTAKKRQARVYSEIYTLTSLGDGTVRARVTAENTILFAGVERFRYTVPAGMTVLEVTGPGIRDWKVDAGELEVLLNFAAEGSYGLTVVMERPLAGAGAHVDAPVLVPVSVERTRGWVGVEARGNLELSAGTVKDATPVDVRTLPPAILGLTDQPLVFGYKYLGAKPAIALSAAQHEEVDVLVTLLDQTAARTTWNREGRRLTSVRYQVRNNRRQFLRLALPHDAELWSASVAGRAVQPARAADGRVMVPLIRSQQAGSELRSYEVEVVYVENGAAADRRGRGTFSATLPVADVPTTYASWTVFSPSGAKIRRRTVDGTLERVDSLSEPIVPPEERVVAAAGMKRGEVESEEGIAEEDVDFGELAQHQQMGPPPPPPPPQVQSSATGGAAIEGGAAPVLVQLPMQGEPTYFEKTLALSGPLTIAFRYCGLERKK
ncbi:MAG: hypothetical protein JW751_00330 [Polyangiaceae bacterium]|nr:hypothetical protein [Polyangiaceae bacterium]